MTEDNVIHVDFREAKRKKAIMEIITMIEDYTFDSAKSEVAADAIADEVVHELLAGLDELGYDLRTDPLVVKDVVMIYETIKSMVYRVAGTKYFMQDNIDQIIRVDDVNGLLEDLLENFDLD